MRRFAPTCGLLLLAVTAGCQHHAGTVCDSPTKAAAAPAADGPPAAAPAVEVKAPQEIHVKAPPQVITVTLPPHEPEDGCEHGPHCKICRRKHAAAPAYAPPPAYAPAPPMASPAPGTVLAASTQEYAPLRSRITLGLDFFHLPIPYPRLFSSPAEQEVVTRQTYQAAPPPAAYAPAPPVYAPPPAYAPAPVGYAPIYAPPPGYAPPPPAYAPAPPAYAPGPMYAPPQQGMICVPVPNGEPCPDCKPGCEPGHLLQHLKGHNK